MTSNLASYLKRFYSESHLYYKRLAGAEWERYHSRYCQALIQQIPSNSSVFDLGCGVGQVVHAIALKGFKAWGGDISVIALQQAKEGGTGRFVLLDSGTLPFKEGTFDCVGCCGILEHLPDPKRALSELVRILKPKGRIVVASPNFLTVVGLESPHPCAKGLFRRSRNLLKLTGKTLSPSLWKQPFDALTPVNQLNPNEFEHFDDDAVWAIEPILLKRFLSSCAVDIRSHSCLIREHKPWLDRMSRWPLLRTLGGGILVVGQKRG